MTYTAPGAATFVRKGGSLSSKITSELSLIDTELDTLAASDAAGLKVARVALTGGDENAFAFAWQNPESKAIIVTRIYVDVTTKGAVAGALLDCGPAESATAHSDTLIDGLDIASATILADNITNKGSNGLPFTKLDVAGGTTAFITGQILVKDAAALAGYAYIFYHKVS